MGYDLSMIGTVFGEAEALDALDAPYRTALAFRDTFPKEQRGTYQEGVDEYAWGTTYANAHPGYAAAQTEVMRLSDERDRANLSYFRLNIWGMARYRDAMEIVGMGHWSEQPDWPEPQDFGFASHEEVWAAKETLDESDGDLTYKNGYDITVTAEMLDKARKFNDEQQAVLSSHPGETPGIPLWKFSSNDGWIVTPGECSSALQIFGQWLSCALPWEEALHTFRTASTEDRNRVVADAARRHGMEPIKVGHPPFPGESHEQDTHLDVLGEDYWLQWLTFLANGVQCSGFSVH